MVRDRKGFTIEHIQQTGRRFRFRHLHIHRILRYTGNRDDVNSGRKKTLITRGRCKMDEKILKNANSRLSLVRPFRKHTSRLHLMFPSCKIVMTSFPVCIKHL